MRQSQLAVTTPADLMAVNLRRVRRRMFWRVKSNRSGASSRGTKACFRAILRIQNTGARRRTSERSSMTRSIPLIRSAVLMPMMRWMRENGRSVQARLDAAGLGYASDVAPVRPVPLLGVLELFRSMRRAGRSGHRRPGGGDERARRPRHIRPVDPRGRHAARCASARRGGASAVLHARASVASSQARRTYPCVRAGR